MIRAGFGSVLYTSDDPLAHPLLRHLAPEPLEERFDGAYLHAVTRRRRVAIKQLLLNSRLVTGVGNIYASEALLHARIRPRRAARTLNLADCTRLVAAIRRVLGAAIRAGGTTLRDYVGARRGARIFSPAAVRVRACGSRLPPLSHAHPADHAGQRSTYYCPSCQQ